MPNSRLVKEAQLLKCEDRARSFIRLKLVKPRRTVEMRVYKAIYC